MAHLILIVSYIILIYFFALTIGYIILLIASLSDILRQFRESELGHIADMLKAIKGKSILTIIVPVYNEKERVFNTIFSILNSNYAPVEIILVNDASTDNTLELLTEKFSLYEIPSMVRQRIKAQPIRKIYRSAIYPTLSVIDKERGFGSGADNINVGINACTTPLYMTVDADTVLEPDAISQMLFAFFSKAHCIVVGGAVYVLNGTIMKDGKILEVHIAKQQVPAFQVIEYVRSFLFGRAGWNVFKGALCYAGAFTLFEKEIVMDVGGYDRRNFAYDAEITLHLHEYMIRHRYPYTAYFTSNAFAWTEVPQTAKHYWRQRNFWQRGLLCTFLKYKYMFFNPRYGLVGLFNVPFNFFFEVLSPVIEFISYVMVVLALIFNILALQPLIWSLILAWGFATFLNLANFLLNIITYNRYFKPFDIIRVTLLVIVEMLWFRQLRATCCFIATCQFFWNRLRGGYI